MCKRSCVTCGYSDTCDGTRVCQHYYDPEEVFDLDDDAMISYNGKEFYEEWFLYAKDAIDELFF